MNAFEQLFEHHSELFAILDRTGRFLRINPAWERWLGYRREDLEETSITQVAVPEDRAKLVAILDQPVVNTPEPVYVRLQTRQESFVFVSLNIANCAESNEILLNGRIGRHGQAQVGDIDQSALNAHWNAVNATVRDIVVTSDAQGRVTAINHVPPETTREALMGAPMFDFIPGEARSVLLERFEHVMGTGEMLEYETPVTFPNGAEALYSSRLGPISDEAQIIGTVLVTRDITYQREAEKARQAAERQLRAYTLGLERSNRELERFASVASHDLQEPLRKIQAFGDRLTRKFAKELHETAQDYIRRMQNAAQRMQSLINDLLMYSRLTTRERRTSMIDLSDIVSKVLGDLEIRIEENHGQVIVDKLPTIEADEFRMRQLFQNLIGNALKFHRADVPPVVHITTEPVYDHHLDATNTPADSPQDSHMTLPIAWRIRVSDNGIGIPETYRDRIFGIFERLHTRGTYEGTGVGLAISRKIAEQHCGTLKVEDNEAGHGVTFSLTLPEVQPRKEELR